MQEVQMHIQLHCIWNIMDRNHPLTSIRPTSNLIIPIAKLLSGNKQLRYWILGRAKVLLANELAIIIINTWVAEAGGHQGHVLPFQSHANTYDNRDLI